MNHPKKEPGLGFFSVITLAVLLFSGIKFDYVDRIGVLTAVPTVDISRIISLMIIMSIPVVLGGLLSVIRRNGIVLGYIVWVLIATTLSFIYTYTSDYPAPFSNTVRTIEQLAGFTIGLLLGYYAYRLSVLNKQALFRVINLSMLLIFLGVLVQLVLSGVGSLLSERLYGLSGEPKGLGLLIVPYLFGLIVTPIKQVRLRKYLIFICIVGIILTMSATVFLALIMMLLIYGHIYGLLNKRTIGLLFVLTPLLFVLIFSVPELRYMMLQRFVNYATGQYTEGVQTSIDLPIVGEITVEANDFPVAMFFKENPIFLLTGVGIGQESILTYLYIEKFGGIGFIDVTYSGYITPNSALLSNAANYGLILVAFLAFAGLRMTKRLSKKLQGLDKFIWFFFFSHFFISLVLFRTELPLSMSLIVMVSLYRYHIRNQPVQLQQHHMNKN